MRMIRYVVNFHMHIFQPLLGLLDTSAAFDTNDQAIVLQKMDILFHVSGNALSLLNSFLRGRTQQVHFNISVSSVKAVILGASWEQPRSNTLPRLHC